MEEEEHIFAPTANMKKLKLHHISQDVFKAGIIIGIDVIISRIVFYSSIASPSLYVSYLVPGIYGCLIGMGLVYLFFHDGVFHFVKLIEEKQKKKEEEFLNLFLHLGKILAIQIITIFGGVLMGAFSIRLLYKKAKYKYLLICLANIPATLFWVSLAKGIISYVR